MHDYIAYICIKCSAAAATEPERTQYSYVFLYCHAVWIVGIIVYIHRSHLVVGEVVVRPQRVVGRMSGGTAAEIVAKAELEAERR